jgi:hypothetical protein
MDKQVGELTRFLSHISVWDTLNRQAKEHYQSRLAPNFRLFDLFRCNEMTLSRCLAFLLDPKEAHGQGELFLSKFLQILPENLRFPNSGEATIFTEYTMPDSRRLDLLLTRSNSAIGIENKPWAEDQLLQLYDYAKWMNERYIQNHWLLIYLCNNEIGEKTLPNGSNPNLKDGVFPFTFYRFVEWLEECALHVTALQVRIFINELAQFIRENINGESNMDEQNELTQLILSSPENIRATFLAASSLRNIKIQMWKDFLKELRSQLTLLEVNLLNDDDLLDGKKETGFSIIFHSGDRLALRWQFEHSNYGGLCFGIVNHDETEQVKDSVLYPQIRSAMNQCFPYVSEEGTDFWPWWCFVEPNINVPNFWDMNPDAWLLLQDSDENSLAKKVIKIVKNMKEKFDLRLLRG